MTVKGNRRQLVAQGGEVTPESLRFGHSLRMIRKTRNMTAAQLLAVLGMDYSDRTLRKWEEGKGLWEAVTLVNRLADALKVSTDQLFGRAARTPNHHTVAREMSAILIPDIRRAVEHAVNRIAPDPHLASDEEAALHPDVERGLDELAGGSTTPAASRPAPPPSATSPTRRRSAGGR